MDDSRALNDAVFRAAADAMEKLEKPFERDIKQQYAKEADLFQKAADAAHQPAEKQALHTLADTAAQVSKAGRHAKLDYAVYSDKEGKIFDGEKALGDFLGDEKNLLHVPAELKEQLIRTSQSVSRDRTDIRAVERMATEYETPAQEKMRTHEISAETALEQIKQATKNITQSQEYKTMLSEVSSSELQSPQAGGTKPAPAQSPKK